MGLASRLSLLGRPLHTAYPIHLDTRTTRTASVTYGCRRRAGSRALHLLGIRQLPEVHTVCDPMLGSDCGLWLWAKNPHAVLSARPDYYPQLTEARRGYCMVTVWLLYGY